MDSKIYEKRKWYLAAFLNLLVLPGSGSLVLGRRLDGFIQIGLSFLGMVLLTSSIKSVFPWVMENLSRFNKNFNPLGWYEDGVFFWGSSPKPLAFLDYIFVSMERGQYPTCLGVSSISIFILSIGIFLFVWIYSLISLLQVGKK